MNLKRKYMLTIGLVICLVAGLLWVGGCNKGSVGNEPSNVNSQIITDCLGRKVQVPIEVNRVACLCPESGYTLAMLNQGDKIVAATNGMKRDIILTEMYPSIKEAALPKLSETINIEELVKTQADVIFMKNDVSLSEALIDKLNKSQIPYLVVTYNSMQEQQYAIEMIGKVVGAYDEAKRYNTFYQDCINRVQSRLADIPFEKRVRVYHSVNEATRTDNKGSLAADWTQAAGAYNVSVNQDLKLLEGDYYASLEQILLWDPEVMLVNEGTVVNYILSNKQWSPLQAVKDEKVYKLPSAISRWGHPSSPETPMVVLWTAKTLYPDKFVDVDMAAEVKYFYREFFDFQLSDDIIQKILNGEGMRAPR